MDRIKAEHLSDMARTIGNYYVQDGRRYALLAKHLWDEGYRKVPKGKWISASTKPGVNAGMKCSICGARIKNSEHFNGNHRFCHKCGARMINGGN